MNANLLMKLPNLAKKASSQTDLAMAAFNNLVGVWKECKQITEIEKTKREKVKAWRIS